MCGYKIKSPFYDRKFGNFRPDYLRKGVWVIWSPGPRPHKNFKLAQPPPT